MIVQPVLPAQTQMTSSRHISALLAMGIFIGCEPELPPGLGDSVPDASLEIIEAGGSQRTIGTELRISELRGKPVVLDFWASWCVPCVAQHNYITSLKREYGDRIEIVGVLHDDSEESARLWLRREGATYPTAVEENGRLAKTFWVRSLPRFLLLDPDGRLAWDFMGAAVGPNTMNADSVSARLEAMLESGPQ